MIRACNGSAQAVKAQAVAERRQRLGDNILIGFHRVARLDLSVAENFRVERDQPELVGSELQNDRLNGFLELP